MIQNEAEFKLPASEAWKPLLDLIPEIERIKKYQMEIQPGRASEDGITYHLPVYQTAEVVWRFEKLAYETGIIINFDWPGWNEGRRIVTDPEFDFDSIDITTKCKVITAIVRNNRFCEGTLAGAFQSGLILKVLKSIQKQLGM